MKKTKLSVWMLSAVSAFAMSNASAVDLVQAYNQALVADPTYRMAEASWMSAKEEKALARVGSGSAGSGLFPNISASGSFGKSRAKRDQTRYRSTNRGFGLSLTQPIFNLATWSSIREAGFGVKAAYATYMNAGQDLINRVAYNYFEVLRVQEELQYTINQKKAVKAQLITDLQKYKVGMAAATGVYNSQASYDEQVSNEITARNSLLDQAENLRAITGKLYKRLQGLPANKLPAIVPQPASMSGWVKTATQQSYAIKSAHMAALQKKQAIRTNLAGMLPSLSAVGTYSANSYEGNSYTNSLTNSASATLQLSVPLYRGGYTSVSHRQKKADYLGASDNLALVYATTRNSTRQNYLSVISGIAKIDASYQRIIAQKKNLDATRAAYRVGTRTMVNLLEAISDLYSAKKAWANARYDYLDALFQLKYDAGTLSPADLDSVNHWLKKGVHMRYEQLNYKKDTYYDAVSRLSSKGSSSQHKKHAHKKRHSLKKKTNVKKTAWSNRGVHVALMSGEDFDPSTIQLPQPI